MILGQYTDAFLNHSFSLQVPFEYVTGLPLDQWKEEWFDACNPRAMLPIKNVLSLLQGTSCAKTVKKWANYMNDIHNPHLDDASRDVNSKRVLFDILDSGYVHLPCLAWLINRLDWEHCLRLCVEVFGEGETDDKVSEKYRDVEAAIMKENLFRHYADLQRLFTHVFSIDAQAAGSRIAPEHRTQTLAHVVRLTHIILSGKMQPMPTSPAVTKITGQGYLAHIVSIENARQNPAAQELLRKLVRSGLPCPSWMELVSCW
jgi:hypothetical protein